MVKERGVVRAMWSLHRFTADGRLCIHTPITHHEVPAHNVMTQPTFAPLYRRAHSLLTRPLTARLLSVWNCVEDATTSRNCLGLRVPPERDVIDGSVTVETVWRPC